MNAVVHCVPARQDNYIWLLEYAPGYIAVVDPADAQPVLERAELNGWTITHILNTHWHPDHVGGNQAIQAATQCTIIGPAREGDKIPGIDTLVDDGDSIKLGTLHGEVLFVGAHTAGHIAFYFPSAHILFPGDTIFAMGCGRLFEGTPADMFAAMNKFRTLPPQTQIYCAHEYTLSNARFAITVEPQNKDVRDRLLDTEVARQNNQPTVPFTLEQELLTNPFLRARDVGELGIRRKAKDDF